MRTKSRSAAVTLVLVAALAATGCTPEAPRANEKPTPTSTPLFASDEEALAAAEEAYAAYLAASDAITAEGGASPERIDPFVASQLRQSARDSLSEFQEANLHTVGASTFDTVTLQQVRTDESGASEVSIYVCLDISAVRLIATSGADVTPGDRSDRLPLTVSFRSAGQTADLVLEESESWAGDNFCAK
jgi:hypothetical protein